VAYRKNRKKNPWKNMKWRVVGDETRERDR
jgi:hypothetical protein